MSSYMLNGQLFATRTVSINKCCRKKPSQRRQCYRRVPRREEQECRAGGLFRMLYRVFLVTLSIFLTIIMAPNSRGNWLSRRRRMLESLFSGVLGPLLCLQIDTCWHSKHDVSRNIRLSPPLRKQLLKPLRLHQRDARRLSERGASMNNIDRRIIGIACYHFFFFFNVASVISTLMMLCNDSRVLADTYHI
ncbi:hypothetical protein B0H13DRAFT_2298727, partial [Mycena leptocephala]